MRKLLVLDLDETLMYAAEEALGRPADFQVERFHVYKRPHVQEFLSSSAELFDLAVWTTSTEDYAEAIIQKLFPGHVSLAFVWARQRCTIASNPDTRERFWIKDLKKLKKHGYLLERVIVVDDSPEKLQRNYGNLVMVKPYQGDPDDAELLLLLPFLRRLATLEDVRKIEKRFWGKPESGGAPGAMP